MRKKVKKTLIFGEFRGIQRNLVGNFLYVKPSANFREHVFQRFGKMPVQDKSGSCKDSVIFPALKGNGNGIGIFKGKDINAAFRDFLAYKDLM